MLKTSDINKLIRVEDTYQAPEALMKIIFDKEKREELFRAFIQLESNLAVDSFSQYYEEEHSETEKHAQMFSPPAIADLLSKLVGGDTTGEGFTFDVASGTGGLTIAKWAEDSKKPLYNPSNNLYHCEEISDRAMPFLLMNLLMRGMNATVVHGDTLSRKIKQVYFIQNEKDEFLSFSSLNVMPHSETVEKFFDVREWLEEAKNHIESPSPMIESK